MKQLRVKYKKAVDLGKRSGGGRIIMAYFDLCTDMWYDSPSTNSIQGKYCIDVC